MHKYTYMHADTGTQTHRNQNLVRSENQRNLEWRTKFCRISVEPQVAYFSFSRERNDIRSFNQEVVGVDPSSVAKCIFKQPGR